MKKTDPLVQIHEYFARLPKGRLVLSTTVIDPKFRGSSKPEEAFRGWCARYGLTLESDAEACTYIVSKQ